MTTDEKIESLLVALLKQTEQGLLRWQQTEEENTFRLIKTSGVIRIFRSEDSDPYAGASVGRRLTIVNNKGREIEDYWPDYPQHNLFDNLYVAVRRSAYSVNQVIDEIISEIGAHE